MPLLATIDLCKTYSHGRNQVQAVKRVSIEVGRGEVVSLEGPSGSGKTTLLSILGCILSATSGQVIVEDRAVTSADPAALAAIRKHSIGFVFQQFNLFNALTAQENVEFALNVKGVRGPEATRQAAEVIDAVGLAARRDFLPRDLSGGEKQRVAVARALASRAPIILADEPTANLDSENALQILTLFRDLVKQNPRALVIATHDPRVRSIADRVIRMADGEIRP